MNLTQTNEGINFINSVSTYQHNQDQDWIVNVNVLKKDISQDNTGSKHQNPALFNFRNYSSLIPPSASDLPMRRLLGYQAAIRPMKKTVAIT